MEEYINYMIGLYVIEEYMNLKLYSVYDWFIKHLIIDIFENRIFCHVFSKFSVNLKPSEELGSKKVPNLPKTLTTKLAENVVKPN